MHLCVLLVCSLLSLSRRAKAQPLVLCMLCRHISLLPSAFAATLRGMLQRLPKEQSSSPSSASPPLPPSLRLSHTCPCQDMTTRGSTLSNKRQWSRCCVYLIWGVESMRRGTSSAVVPLCCLLFFFFCEKMWCFSSMRRAYAADTYVHHANAALNHAFSHTVPPPFTQTASSKSKVKCAGACSSWFCWRW